MQDRYDQKYNTVHLKERKSVTYISAGLLVLVNDKDVLSLKAMPLNKFT